MKKCDKDQPWTWKPYRAGMCDGCSADCCRMPVEVKFEDLVTMGLASPDEAQQVRKLSKRLIREKHILSFREASGLFMLAQAQDGSCIHLGKDNLCKIYEKRPGVCRQFPSIGPKPGFCPANRASR